MRSVFNLGPRLQTCADMVRSGHAFADIGSDHGYLPIWLLRAGKVPAAIAVDVNEAPLDCARRNAEKYGVPLTCVLSNGVAALSPAAAQDIAMAGMGGELIAQLIAAAPWLQEKHLILQPMSAPEKLRSYLFANGYCIHSEIAVLDAGKTYSVLSVWGGTQAEADVYMGKLVPGAPHSAAYARRVIGGLQNHAKGLTGSALSVCLWEIAMIKERFLHHDNCGAHL